MPTRIAKGYFNFFSLQCRYQILLPRQLLIEFKYIWNFVQRSSLKNRIRHKCNEQEKES